MELLPLGPVLFIDTAGVDDEGALGELRVQRTRQVLERTDLGVLVAEARPGEASRTPARRASAARGSGSGGLQQGRSRRAESGAAGRARPEQDPVVRAVAREGKGVLELREALLAAAPEDFIDHPAMISDLVGPGELAVLVVPIDKEAPRGRLILPQVRPSAICSTATRWRWWSRSAS